MCRLWSVLTRLVLLWNKRVRGIQPVLCLPPPCIRTGAEPGFRWLSWVSSICDSRLSFSRSQIWSQAASRSSWRFWRASCTRSTSSFEGGVKVAGSVGVHWNRSSRYFLCLSRYSSVGNLWFRINVWTIPAFDRPVAFLWHSSLFQAVLLTAKFNWTVPVFPLYLTVRSSGFSMCSGQSWSQME